MRSIYSLIFAVLFMGTMSAQVRYIDEVFDDVNVTSDVMYAANISVITTLQGLPPMALPQNMDIYEPAGDTETNRPLIIYMHTGNFLPIYLNGGATGEKTDYCAVEICSRFARMGYVVASIDYRLGWNPLAATQSERTYQLINAAYRGVQDARTAVRYFRMNADVAGNEYGIDPDKIGYFGEGTGGYATLAATTITNYNDIILDDMGAPISKFWYDPGDGSSIPMVIEGVNGDPEGKYDGYAPMPDGSYLQLCIGHYPDYSSDVSFNVNLGGALGDLNWLDQGDPSMVTFQCPHDPFAPYTTGVLIVPTTNELVVEVSGGFDIHSEINAQGSPNNNAVYQDANLSDDLSNEAITNGGFDGLFPVLNNYVDGVPTEPYDGSPWQWWDQATVQAVDAANGTSIWATQMFLNPTMGPDEALSWIDVIQAYSVPRIALALGVASTGPGCTDESACNFNALASSDDGSCSYAAAGYNCDGESLNIEGCTDAMACDYNPAATVDTGCSYLSGDGVPTGMDNVWLVGLTVTGTPYEAFSGGCELNGGVNPNVSINGVIMGDGSTPLVFAGATDPTGLLGDLVALTATVGFSACGGNMTVSALGNYIPMIPNGQFWISPVPVNEDGQYLWAGPMMNFDLGCGDPTACNFLGNPCELSVACSYAGCTDEAADNYDPAAGCDDESCVYSGCTNEGATNYDADANSDDGSCLFLLTVSVNMSTQGVSGDGVHVAGSFQGWDPGASACTDAGNGTWEYSIAVSDGDYEFKFINGNAWGSDEYVDGDCSNGSGNRTISVSGAAASNGNPCWASCDDCPFVAVSGCTYADADNYDEAANDDDGSCVFSGGSDCVGDLNGDGVAATSDLLLFLSVFGQTCE